MCFIHIKGETFMRMNKRLFYVGSFVAILTFLASLILTVMNKTENISINYSINVLLAIFGSSFVLIITSIWGYLNERKNYEIQYACFFRDFLLRIVRFLIIYDGKKSSPKEVFNIAGDIHALYDSFAYVQAFQIYGYFLKKGCRCKFMRILQNKSFEYAKELTRIRILAQNAYENNETEFSFKTSITVSQLENEKGLIDTFLKNK